MGEDVVIETSYSMSGILNVTIPDDVSEEEIIEALEESLSELLGIHPSNIELEIDEDGKVIYTITDEEFTTIEDVQEKLNEPTFVDELESKVQEEIPEFEIQDVEVNSEIEVEV